MNSRKVFSKNSLKKYQVSEIFIRVNNPVKVDISKYYNQIGIRSHGKGIFFKEPIIGKLLGNKRVFWLEPDCFIVNIVFAWERAVARTTDKHKNYIASHRFPMYKPNLEIVNLDYITFFFKTRKGQYLLELASPGGAGRNKTLGQKEFERLEILLPPINLQIKIANFIILLESKMQKQQEKIEMLQEYKKGMMQKIFSREICFKNEDGEEFGEWEEKTFHDVANIRRGASPRPIADPKWFSSTSKIGWLRISDVTASGVYIRKVTQYLSEEGIKKSVLLEDPHLILSIAASIGKPVINNIPLCIHDGFIVFKDLKLNMLFGYYYLEHFQDKWLQFRQPGSQFNLNSDLVGNLNIIVPSNQEQQQIANFFSQIDLKLEKESEKLLRLNEQKKGFMQQMYV